MTSSKRYVMSLVEKKENAKQAKGKDDKELYAIFQATCKEMNAYFSEKNFFDMGNATTAFRHFLEDKKDVPTDESYYRGDIVMIDFGCMNFGYEFNFLHPAVVLSQTQYHVLVAPCSSRKYGKGYPDVLDAETSDGFVKKTGIILDGIRCCSKTRIDKKIGEASEALLDKIEDYFLCRSNRYKAISEQTIKKLKEKDAIIEELRRQLRNKEKEDTANHLP